MEEGSENPWPQRPSTPDEALEALRAGNRRYVSGEARSIDYGQLREQLAETQRPFAAIIGCADSRVSPPQLFDAAPGDIFVSRVAGNSVGPGTLGSTEYAVAELGVVLLMVLGHSDCGAVKAAIELVEGRASFPAQTFGAIGSVIEPVVEPVRELAPERRTVGEAASANAAAQAARLANADPIIKPAVASERLRVVAAVYDIGSGRVTIV